MIFSCPHEMDMVAGTRVGTVIENKYRLDEQIGQGGMGTVYRGTQLAVDRQVAIKLLHPSFAGHDKVQARFEVEAKAIARLNHPNCITLFDFGYAPELSAFYTVVEFIEGIPLDRLVTQQPDLLRVLGVIRQIASALGHAHHHGILHRDLKPENIMLSSMTDGSEMVKVLDFGIAQIMKGSDDSDDFETDRLTRVGEVFGTPAYMSPEQATSSRDLTTAADIYSLGVIFYELLEGRLPFTADNPVDILSKHLSDPPPPFQHARVSPSIESIVVGMLEKDPAKRPASGAAVIALLDTLTESDLKTGNTVQISGQIRPSEPTLLDTPDSAEMLALQSGPQRTLVHTDLDLGADSEIYELEDLVSDEPPAAASVPPPNARPAKKPTAPPAAANTSTMLISEDTSFDVVQRDSRNKILFLLIFLTSMIATSAGLFWWFGQENSDNGFGLAPATADSVLPAMEAVSDPYDLAEAGDDDEPPVTREISIADVQDDPPQEESAAEESAPTARPRPRTTRPSPSPRTIELPPRDQDRSTEEAEEPRRPQRLGL